MLQAAQLGMVPVRGGRLVQASQIPTQDQLQFANAAMAATLPSGAEVALRLKPLPLLELAAVRGR